MINNFENLSKFFEQIKAISFWQRIFNWTPIKKVSYDAYEEFLSLKNDLSNDNNKLDDANNQISILNTKIDGFKENNIKLEARIEPILKKNEELTTENTRYNQTENSRKEEHNRNIIELNKVQEQLDSNRKRIQEDREEEIKKIFENMQETWSVHEDQVKQHIKAICQKHIISYIDKVPFKGSPDNTIEICNEYIIFDAKSPANDNLENFPNYIKSQVESVNKYAKEKNVKKEIFLVIPSNTLNVINQYVYNLADYNVNIITLDALEPIVLSLKKIEDYEFVEQLNPEERENICRIIGKFVHTTKRKIQIDHFFSMQFFEILSKCKNELPQEILEMVVEYEKAEKLNPPQEKRAKQLLEKDLREASEKIKAEAEIKEIEMPDEFDDINKLPLYKKK